MSKYIFLRTVLIPLCQLNKPRNFFSSLYGMHYYAHCAVPDATKLINFKLKKQVKFPFVYRCFVFQFKCAWFTRLLMMEASSSSEKSVNFYQTTRRNTLEEITCEPVDWVQLAHYRVHWQALGLNTIMKIRVHF
jgi:hypothetical protein